MHLLITTVFKFLKIFHVLLLTIMLPPNAQLVGAVVNVNPVTSGQIPATSSRGPSCPPLPFLNIVPTLSEWSLIVLALLMMIFGINAVKQRIPEVQIRETIN